MQSTTGTQLTTTSQANYRRPAFDVSFMWDGTNWTDESVYCRRWSRVLESADRRKGGITAVGCSVSGTADITLANTSNRFSPLLSTGALYSYIGGLKLPRHKVRIRGGFLNAALTAQVLPQFTGYIVDAREDAVAKTVTLRCRDESETLKQRTLETTQVYASTTAGAYIKAIIDLVNTDLTAEGRDTITYSLDAGRFGFDYAWMEGDYVWEELKGIAEADGGRLYFDHSGVLRYEDASHFLLSPHTASQYSFTVARFSGLAHNWTFRDPIVNAVKVIIRPRYVGAREVIYRAGEVIVVKPGETVTHKARFREPAYSAITMVANTDYIATTPAGFDMTGDIEIVASAGAKSATLTITNNNASQTAYLRKCEIRGHLVLQRETDEIELEDATSIAQYGRNEATISSPYIQNRFHGEAIGHFHIDREKDAKHSIELTGITCTPYLEVGDRVRVVEADSGTNVAAFIMRDEQSMDVTTPTDAKYVQSLVLLPVTSLFPYTDYFDIGHSELGAGHRYFY